MGNAASVSVGAQTLFHFFGLLALRDQYEAYRGFDCFRVEISGRQFAKRLVGHSVVQGGALLLGYKFTEYLAKNVHEQPTLSTIGCIGATILTQFLAQTGFSCFSLSSREQFEYGEISRRELYCHYAINFLIQGASLWIAYHYAVN